MSMIKYPRSKFLLVECECGNKIVVFSHSSNEVKCPKCGKTLVIPTGGKAKVYGKVVETYGAYS